MGKFKQITQGKRFWYSITPLLLTLAVIILINLFSSEGSPAPTTPSQNTAVPEANHPNDGQITRPPILPATILPSPTPSATPKPDLPESAQIGLLGPPAGSSLPLNGRTVFYWTYSEQLLPGQVFALQIIQFDQITTHELVTQPNFGDAYQVSIAMDEITAAGTAVWQIHLKWRDQQDLILSSEERIINLLPR